MWAGMPEVLGTDGDAVLSLPNGVDFAERDLYSMQRSKLPDLQLEWGFLLILQGGIHSQKWLMSPLRQKLQKM